MRCNIRICDVEVSGELCESAELTGWVIAILLSFFQLSFLRSNFLCESNLK
jgi:hypothetical protein